MDNFDQMRHDMLLPPWTLCSLHHLAGNTRAVAGILDCQQKHRVASPTYEETDCSLNKGFQEETRMFSTISIGSLNIIGISHSKQGTVSGSPLGAGEAVAAAALASHSAGGPAQRAWRRRSDDVFNIYPHFHPLSSKT